MRQTEPDVRRTGQSRVHKQVSPAGMGRPAMMSGTSELTNNSELGQQVKLDGLVGQVRWDGPQCCQKLAGSIMHVEPKEQTRQARPDRQARQDDSPR